MNNKTITLSSIDKIYKNNMLINRLDFKQNINELRIVINQARRDAKLRPRESFKYTQDHIINIVDTIRTKYNISQTTIVSILQIDRRILPTWRKEMKAPLKDTGYNSLLTDRLVAIAMFKADLKTVKELAIMYNVTGRTIYTWLNNDKLYGMCLDKAIAFRHAKI